MNKKLSLLKGIACKDRDNIINMFKTRTNRKPSFIITIGASAGGLNAISELISQLPEDLDAAVFVVIHVSKVGLGDFLIARLQKYTLFKCVLPRDEEVIHAGYIYIAPPDQHLLVNDGKVVIGQGPAENRWRPSIDVLFRSAAAHYGNRVIGIILTGFLNDGTVGMSAIKRSNGFCIVQDPNEAEYPDMPLSVINAVEVDYSISLRTMGETIVSIVKNPGPQEVVVEANILKEAAISERTVTSIDAVAQLGEKSFYSCPDCGGGLWNVVNTNIKRYRCHIGHSYSEEDLVIKQSESLEAALWVGLRMMEERKMLLTKISNDEINKGLSRLADLHKKNAKELDGHIEKLKSVLFAAQKD